MPPEEDLIRLLKFGSIRKIRDLIKNNSSMDLHCPNKNLTTPLTSAIERSDPAILTLLIDKIPGNLDATLTQPCGKTALMHAAYYARNAEILHVLIRKGSDPKKTDINGWNCLFYAVIGKQLHNVSALLDCQVSIESRDCEGRTPLMISVYLSNFEMFDFLMNRGADINAVDNSGLTVLHLAILRRKRDCVIELLSRNPNSIDFPTPLTKVSTQQLVRELMSAVLPIQRNSDDDEYDGDSL